MKLTLKIKLLPTESQFNSLKKTMIEANMACDYISEVVHKKKIYNRFNLHKEVYYVVRETFKLSAQITANCIGRVADSYKINKKAKRTFNQFGAIPYNERIVSYKNDGISMCTVDGRIKGIKFACHDKKYIPFIKGEVDLIFKKGKFYLHHTIDIPDVEIKNTEDFIGCDFGQADICTLSDGTNYNSKELKKVRKHYSKVRASVQSKGTKGAKKLLKRLSGKERRFVTINNHTISKQIVAKALEENKGIAIEDLIGVRKRGNAKSKIQRTELNRWSFYQLRQFMTYKAKLSGIKLCVIPPAYTSQTCSCCLRIGFRKGKNFSCINCGNTMDADYNAAKNIATWGCVVNQPEKSDMFSCALHL